MNILLSVSEVFNHRWLKLLSCHGDGLVAITCPKSGVHAITIIVLSFYPSLKMLNLLSFVLCVISTYCNDWESLDTCLSHPLKAFVDLTRDIFELVRNGDIKIQDGWEGVKSGFVPNTVHSSDEVTKGSRQCYCWFTCVCDRWWYFSGLHLEEIWLHSHIFWDL